MTDGIEREDGTGFGKPVALNEVQAELLVLFEHFRAQGTRSADKDVVVIKADLFKQHCVEGLAKEVPVQVLLGKAVDGHHGADQPIDKDTLLFHLFEQAGQKFVVEQGDSHEYGDFALGEVVDHPADGDFLAEDTLGSMLDGFKQYGSTAIRVVEGQQCIQDIVSSRLRKVPSHA